MEKIGVEALFKTDAFQKGLDVYKNGLSQADQKGNLFTKGMSTLGAVGGAVLASGLAIGAAAITAVGAALVDCTKAALAMQDVTAQTEAVLKSTGGVAGVTAQDVQNLAEHFATLTKFDDAAVTSAENMLLTFTGIHKDVFPQATEAVLNLATKFGSVEEASVQVGKALQDPISGVTALRRVGVMLTDQQEKQIKSFVAQGKTAEAQKVILNELGTEFGGLAVAMGQTTGGVFARFNNVMDMTKERIGNLILPLLTKLGDTFLTAFSSPAMQANIDKIVTLVGNLATALINFLASPTVQNGLTNLIAGFGTFLDSLSNNPATTLLSDMWHAFQFGGIQGQNFQNVLIGLGRHLLSFLPAWVIDVMKQFQGVLNTLGQWWATNGSSIRATASSVFTNLMAAVQKLAQQVLPTLIENWQKVASWMVANGPLINAFTKNLGIAINFVVNAVVGMWSFIGPALAASMDAFLNLAKFVMQLATGDWAGAWQSIELVVVDVLAGVVQAFNNLFEWVMGTFFGSNMAALRGEWQNNWDMLKIIVDKFFADQTVTWQNDWDMLKLIVATFWTNLVTGINNQVLAVVNAIKGVIDSVKTYLNNIISDFYNIGRSIIQGLINGVVSMANGLVDAAVNAVNNAAKGAKKALQGGSPSKVFMEMGKSMMTGLALGVLENARLPAYAVATSIPAGAITNNYGANNSRTTLNGATFNVPQSVTLSEFLSNARSF